MRPPGFGTGNQENMFEPEKEQGNLHTGHKAQDISWEHAQNLELSRQLASSVQKSKHRTYYFHI